VVVLSLVMLVGSFSIGLLPAIIKASNRIMNLISILGAGLLVGVALIIIIPEGMITLNEALSTPQTLINSEVAKLLTKETNLTLDQITRLHMPSGDENGPNVSLYLGGSLIFGFLIMLLIDQGFSILQERFSEPVKDDDYFELNGDEQQDSRLNCKHVQNSSQSIRNRNCKSGRSESQVMDSLPKILSDDDTKPHNHGKIEDKHYEIDPQTHHNHHDEEHVHNHHGEEHVHDHFHGDSSQIIISTLGLIVHSIADGVALGST